MIHVYVKEIDGLWCGVAYDGEKVFATNFGSRKESTLNGLLTSIPEDVHFQQVEKPSGFAEQVVQTIRRIYDGKDASTDFSLNIEHLPKYTAKVLKTALMVPTGYVTSYGEIAKAAGGGARAVGTVMASNPFAPIVPCHRVVCSDMTLGGYGGGLSLKLALLKREARGYRSGKEVPVDGRKLLVFPVEAVLNKLLKTHA
ncbi:MAG: methylated-DNA--[protein]-cysteine S-methyltransferase [Candidatus Bathyarchaeota archaeon]|nr:methylated-DNA--[protein]-cysteine S-methyltransferase [Candidatus Bathyarchaeota archaeon]